MLVSNAWETVSAQVVRGWPIHERKELHSGEKKNIYPATFFCHLSRWSQLECCGSPFQNMRISLHINVVDHPRGLSGLVFD
jgi:hypothetical protein